jgi:hypothetical protein
MFKVSSEKLNFLLLPRGYEIPPILPFGEVILTVVGIANSLPGRFEFVCSPPGILKTTVPRADPPRLTAAAEPLTLCARTSPTNNIAATNNKLKITFFIKLSHFKIFQHLVDTFDKLVFVFFDDRNFECERFAEIPVRNSFEKRFNLDSGFFSFARILHRFS